MDIVREDIGPMPHRDVSEIHCRHGVPIAVEECDACVRAVARKLREHNARAEYFWAAHAARQRPSIAVYFADAD